LEPAAQRIYNELVRSNGFLPLHDKSEPEAIREVLGMSKKLFKSGVGVLYKNRQIQIQADGIYLNPSTSK